MRSFFTFLVISLLIGEALSWSTPNESASTRRSFFQKAVVAGSAAVAGSVLNVPGVSAAPEILKTPDGKIKYAVLKQPKDKLPPQKGDIVAIEYTGYLTDGTIFDATHAEGKKNALMFEVGGNAVIDGLNEMVLEMGVGQKVQAIVPPDLAFGEKGVCIESGECLIKPGSTLVYDVFLKRSAIPPP